MPFVFFVRNHTKVVHTTCVHKRYGVAIILSHDLCRTTSTPPLSRSSGVTR